MDLSTCLQNNCEEEQEHEQEEASLFVIHSQMRIRPMRIRRNTDPFKPHVR